MVYIQSVKMPTNQIIPFNIMDYSGGLNNRSALTAFNQANDMLNLTFYDNTVLEKRRGSTTYDDVLHPSAVTHLDEFIPYTGSPQLVRASESRIVIENGETPKFDIALTTGKGVDGQNFQGKYFFVDGSTLRVYGKFPTENNTFTRIIGTPVTNFKAFTVISTPDTYTPLDATYTKGVTVYDYTNSNVWYEPCANEKGDPYLGVSVPPVKARFIASLNGRIYLSGNDSDDDTCLFLKWRIRTTSHLLCRFRFLRTQIR